MTLRVTLFDRFIIADDAGGALIRLRPRSQRLLAYLILRHGRPVSRKLLAFTLWPNSSEDEALATSRRAVNDLRTTLDPLSPAQLIVTPTGDLRWNVDGCASVDVLEFERLVVQDTLGSLHAAAELYAGDLLPIWDDEWVIVERERLRERQTSTPRRLVAHHRALGEHGVAQSLARRAVALDPFAEAAQRDLIATLYEAGDRAAALATYDRLRTLLCDELDVEPMAETETLRAAIVSGVPLPGSDQAVTLSRSTRPPGLSTQIVGRDNELQQLAELWGAVVAGQGQFAIVSGEAGVGKSRLADALADHVESKDGLALVGHCYALDQALPYQPVVEILRAAAMALRHTDLSPVFRSELVRLVPDLAGSVGPSMASGDSVAIDPRSQLFEALLHAFLALARNRPLLLIVEDLHWAAESTIDWLTYVAPRLSGSCLLVVATYRTNEVSATHSLNRLRRRLMREDAISVLVLDRLPATAIRELVAVVSGLPANVSSPIADRLHQETAGNPFFLYEIIRGLIEAGQIVTDSGRWEGPFIDAIPTAQLPLPESLRETIRTRVRRLTEMARVFSVAAAVTGQVFRYDIVREAGGWDDEAALEGLEDLLERSFVRETMTAGEYVFAHHLVRDVLYAELTAPRRAYWHGRIADAYVRTANRLQPSERQELAGRIVHHAGASKRTELIFQWAPVAAAQARRLSAYADALSLLETASDACERMRHDPEIETEGCERRYIDILLDRSEIMPHVGRSVEEHGRVLDAAADLLGRYPDERQQAAYELRHADYLADQRKYGLAAEAALRASDRHMVLNDLRGAVQGRYQAGISWMTIGEIRAAISACEEALDLFRAAGHATGEVLSLSAIAIAGTNLGRIETAMRRLRRALELSEQHDDRLAMARACYGLAFAWNCYYQPEPLRSFAERSMSLYREIGFAWTALRPQFFVAIADRLIGDVDLATATIEQIDADAHMIRDSWLEGWSAQVLGRMALSRGDLRQSESYLERAYGLRQESGEVHNQVSDLAWLGRLRLAQGQGDAAVAHTRLGMTLFKSLRGEYWVWEMPDVFFVHAQALAANGEAAEARRYLERAHERLIEFVTQIDAPSDKQADLAFPINADIVAAWQADRIDLSRL